jgi:NTP pyrophosphatase (non-canonical NTP hydrolase)
LNEFGRFLRGLRANGSLRDMEEITGLSHTYLSTLEKGYDPRSGNPVKPTYQVLKKISETLKVDYILLLKKAGYIQDGGHSMINSYVQEAYEIAKSKGWHDEPREIGTMLALIHSEVSEALEADRKGDMENFAEELADICIRTFDLCGHLGIDLDAAILKKMEKNRGRERKHGKLY